MNAKGSYIPYRQTGYFSDLVLDYLDGSDEVKPFHQFSPDLSGIAEAIRIRTENPVDRSLLVQHLHRQYEIVDRNEQVQAQINALSDPHTFTVTTAHQPNLFTGPLYLIYKIVHAIRLSHELKMQFPQYQFVPVYYMGNEDADFDELSHCKVMGERFAWTTDQTGAFGKMKVDDGLLTLITQLESMLSVFPHGGEIISLLKNAYAKGRSIEEATFTLMHTLFAERGLVVLIADSKELKTQFASVVTDDLLNHSAEAIVGQTIEALTSHYPVQTGVRTINLFYLTDQKRERIEQEGNSWKVVNTSIRFSKEELFHELAQYPERFSPNVILRPLYQELILPNIVFLGGGGELSYWLELKNLFQHYRIPFPVLLLRQSFLLVHPDQERKIQRMGFEVQDFFAPVASLLNQYIQKHSGAVVTIDDEQKALQDLYHQLANKAGTYNQTLESHVHALHRQAEKKLKALLKKIQRAQRRQFSEEQLRIEKLRDELFPGGSLQERSESVWTFYAIHGAELLNELLLHTLPVLQACGVLTLGTEKQ